MSNDNDVISTSTFENLTLKKCSHIKRQIKLRSWTSYKADDGIQILDKHHFP